MDTFDLNIHTIRMPIIMKDNENYFIYPMGFSTLNPPRMDTAIPESTDTLTVLSDRNTAEAFSVEVLDENTVLYRNFTIKDTGCGSATFSVEVLDENRVRFKSCIENADYHFTLENGVDERSHPNRYDLIDALYYIDMYWASEENPDMKSSFEKLYYKRGE